MHLKMSSIKKMFVVVVLVFLFSTVSFFTSDMGRMMLEKVARVSFFTSKEKDKEADKRTSPIYPPKHAERVSLCNVKFKNSTEQGSSSEDTPPDHFLPTIYFVTPTYSRSEQVAELTRLAQTLLHIQNLHWVIAEDSLTCSPAVGSLLERFKMPYTHLTSPMPNIYRHQPMKDRPRGVSSRRAGLQWVLNHHKGKEMMNQTLYKHFLQKQTIGLKNDNAVKIPKIPSSVVYFGDDDNT